MDEQKLGELNKKLTELLNEYNCTLQVAHTIQIVPNKVEEVKEESVEEKTQD